MLDWIPLVTGNWDFALSATSTAAHDVLLPGAGVPDGERYGRHGFHRFLFQWSFCAAATTILSGACMCWEVLRGFA